MAKHIVPPKYSRTNPRNDISAELVRSLLRYDQDTGTLWWREQVAGSTDSEGRHQICVRGTRYCSTRIIWLLMTGEWPSGEIDHKDRDCSNDKWCNLRDSTPSQNSTNQRKMTTNGYRGVVFRGKWKKWRSRITVNGKRMHLGDFDTAKEAYEAYKIAAIKYHGAFSRLI